MSDENTDDKNNDKINYITIKKFFSNPNVILIIAVLLTIVITWVVDKDVGRRTSESIKIYLAFIAAVLVLLWPFLSRKAGVIALSLLTSVAAMNYMRWGPDLLSKRIDSYDVIHYYLASKYFDELGYYDLYPAAILVDSENGSFSKRLRTYRSQDKEHGYKVRPLFHGIARGKKVREEKFTPERWKMFKHDFLQLQRTHQLSKRLWRSLMDDRGYNATPAWIFLMKPITELVSVENIKWLCAVDFIFLAVGLLFIRWAYGNIAALWGLLFFMLSYSLRWPVVTWAFFRYDWVCALMVALALIKRNCHMIAGVLTGLASLFRLFPAVWLFGPAAKAGIQFIQGKTWAARLDKKLLLLAAGFLVTIAVIETATIASLGVEPVKIHAENISEHIKPEELSSRRLGFALGLAFDGKLLPRFIPEERKQKVKSQKTLRLILSAIILGAMAWFLRHKTDDESYAYGYIAFFLLATASYYYAVTRITLIVFHASKLDEWRHRVALAMLFGLEVFSNWAETAYDQARVFLIGYLAWGLTIYILFILWTLYCEQKTQSGLDKLN